MKKLLIIAGVFAAGVSVVSCGGGKGNDPGEAYMPDMYYSRAYESYGYNNTPEDHDLKGKGVRYTAMPVPGTVARGDAFSFPIEAGDSGYAKAKSWNTGFDTMQMTPKQKIEAERLYLINCGICHGTALDGNGPLWKGGEGPYPAAPRNLKDDYTKALSDGQIYHVITYGKGVMGSYASQLKPEQRIWITKYVREKQGGKAPADTSVAKPADTTAAAAPVTPASNQ